MSTTEGDRRILDQFDEYESKIRELKETRERLLSDNMGLAVELERLREDLLRSEKLRRITTHRAWQFRGKYRQTRRELNDNLASITKSIEVLGSQGGPPASGNLS